MLLGPVRSTKVSAVSSGSLSRRIASGRPYTSTNWFSARTTRDDGIHVPHSMRSASRLPSSMTSSVRTGRPDACRRQKLRSASHIKAWRIRDNRERLDGANGPLLALHVNALYDLALRGRSPRRPCP